MKKPINVKSMVNQCPSCGEMFKSIDAFDAHRTGKFNIDRRCMTVVEMQQSGMAINDNGLWVSGLMPESVVKHKRSQEALVGCQATPIATTI